MELDGILEIFSLTGLIFYIIFSFFIIYFFLSVKKIFQDMFEILDSSLNRSAGHLNKLSSDAIELNQKVIASLNETDGILLVSASITEDISETKDKLKDSLENADFLVNSLNNNTKDLALITSKLNHSLAGVDNLSIQLNSSINSIDSNICAHLKPLIDIKYTGKKAVEKSIPPIGTILKYYGISRKAIRVFKLFYKR